MPCDEQPVSEPGETARVDRGRLKGIVLVGDGQHDVDTAGAFAIHEGHPGGEVAP